MAIMRDFQVISTTHLVCTKYVLTQFIHNIKLKTILLTETQDYNITQL